jgi:hypothetical protein
MAAEATVAVAVETHGECPPRSSADGAPREWRRSQFSIRARPPTSPPTAAVPGSRPSLPRGEGLHPGLRQRPPRSFENELDLQPVEETYKDELLARPNRATTRGRLMSHMETGLSTALTLEFGSPIAHQICEPKTRSGAGRRLSALAGGARNRPADDRRQPAERETGRPLA